MAYNSKFTGAQIDALLDASSAMRTSKEDVANKVTTLEADATDVQYPSAKAVKDLIDVVATEVNNNRVLFDVSAAYPTGGTDGTEKYTIETAIKTVPTAYTSKVRYLTFKISDTERELWQFESESYTDFRNAQKWYKMRPSMYHEVEYKDSINSIRDSVPVSERISGLIIHYTTPEGEDKYEMYIGENNATGADFYENFKEIYTASQIDEKILYHTTPAFVSGLRASAIKELYMDKYEEDALYKIRMIDKVGSIGRMQITKNGDAESNIISYDYNIDISNSGILELSATNFHVYMIVEWNKVGEADNVYVNMPITDAAKILENSPTIYSKLTIAPIDYKASVALGLESRLYNESEIITFEDAAEQKGDTTYTYNNIGLVHKATKEEKFNVVYVQMSKLNSQPVTSGSLVVKRGFTISASGGTIIKKIDNFSTISLPESGSSLYEIKLGQDVTLSVGEYLWVYYTGKYVTLRLWNTNNEGGTRVGLYFGGSLNTGKYSTAFVLKQLKGDIVQLDERLIEIENALGTGEDKKTSSPLITLPEDLYVVVGREQTFYYNEFIFGIESSHDNTLTNYNVETNLSPTNFGKNCVCSKEGFTIYTQTAGDYNLTVSIYDQFNNLLTSKTSTLHSFVANPNAGKSILMLGASWIDINRGNRGYTPYLNEALKEIGFSVNFIGTRDAGTSGLKHEGIGGYTWQGFATKPTKKPRFKFYVNIMPSITSNTVYGNNGSTYKLYERGSNYLTMTRESGSTEPSGDTLVKESGEGDDTIIFTSWVPGGTNPLWNNETDSLDFARYRKELCGLDTPLDICLIQLGGNECIGLPLMTTRAEWDDAALKYATSLIDAILADSPNCKIIIDLVGLDSPSITGWSSLGFMTGKRKFQLNVYYARQYTTDLIKSRGDYNQNVFIGQSPLGVNRWYGYGYEDRRSRYFKIDTDTISQEDLEKIKNFNFQQRGVYMYTEGGKEFYAQGYDARGYLLCIDEQAHITWENHNQEFVNAQSVPQNAVPEAGNLTKGGGSSSVDFPVVPYTACYIENNNSKEHWFMNATHPYDLGYKQMAYCVAHQIASLLKE